MKFIKDRLIKWLNVQQPTWTLQKQSVQSVLTLEQRRNRANKAQELLDNEVLQGAFYALKADLMRQIDQVKLEDADGHMRLVMAVQMTKAIERQLWVLVQDGHEAVSQINVRGKRID